MTIKPVLSPIRAGAIDLAGLPAWAAAYLQKHARLAAYMRVPCGGRRRSDGQPCTALSVPGKRRCKWHGGCSTGPRTAEGKAKVAANLRARINRGEVGSTKAAPAAAAKRALDEVHPE